MRRWVAYPAEQPFGIYLPENKNEELYDLWQNASFQVDAQQQYTHGLIENYDVHIWLCAI